MLHDCSLDDFTLRLASFTIAFIDIGPVFNCVNECANTTGPFVGVRVYLLNFLLLMYFRKFYLLLLGLLQDEIRLPLLRFN